MQPLKKGMWSQIAWGETCIAHHSRHLHGLNHAYINHVKKRNLSQTGVSSCSEKLVLLNMSEVKLGKGKHTILFSDDGSQISVIKHSLARSLNLKGYSVTEWISFASKEPERLDTKYYNLRLPLRDGSTVHLKLMGMDSITDNILPGNFDAAYEAFPQVPRGAFDRRGGEVGILIGQDYASLLPTGGVVDSTGSLRFMETKYGSGYVLGGFHSRIQACRASFSVNAVKWRSAVRLSSIRGSKSINHVKGPVHCVDSSAIFMEAESMGINPPRKCKKCLACDQCNFSEGGHTIKEMNELLQLRNSITYNDEKNHFEVDYPIQGDLSLLKDNQYQVEKRACSQEKSLAKKNLLSTYNELIEDYIARGVWVPNSKQNLKDWKMSGGAVHFVGHHSVLNDQSASTPVRVVTD